MFTLRNGSTIENDTQSEIFEKLLQLKPHKSADYLWTDLGMANLYADIYDGQAVYCVDDKSWYMRDIGLWRKDGSSIQAMSNLKELLLILNLYCSEVVDESDDESVKLLEGYEAFCHKCMSATICHRILEMAESDMAVRLTDFDSDPYLLNCVNGVYDLRSMTFRAHLPEDRFMLSTSAAYSEASEPCERWFSFVDEVTSGDKEKARFLQRALGYSLLGLCKEECMFFAYGQTRSGKGTLFNSVGKVLGMGTDHGYGGSINSSLICEVKGQERDYNSAEPMLADTVGLRYCTLSETKQSSMLDANCVKSLTGQDPRKTRKLRCDPFTFTPQFTMWLSTNFLPRVTDNTVFASDRIWVIEFCQHFEEGQRDNSLKELFESHDAQTTILRWLIDGYRDYKENGLNPPQVVRESTNLYAHANDRVRCFLEDRIEKCDGGKVSNAALYAAYKSWCADPDREYNPGGTTTFYRSVSRFYNRYDANGSRGFRDMRIKETD